MPVNCNSVKTTLCSVSLVFRCTGNSNVLGCKCSGISGGSAGSDTPGRKGVLGDLGFCAKKFSVGSHGLQILFPLFVYIAISNAAV